MYLGFGHFSVINKEVSQTWKEMPFLECFQDPFGGGGSNDILFLASLLLYSEQPYLIISKQKSS